MLGPALYRAKLGFVREGVQHDEERHRVFLTIRRLETGNRCVVPYAPAFDLHLIGVYDSQRESQAPASRADFRSVARMVTAAASATTLLRGGDDPVLSLAVPAVQR